MKREEMRYKIIPRIMIVLLLTAGFAFAGIIYNGNDYTETMMPFSQTGSSETFIVVSGTVSSHSGSRLSIYEINGVNMLNGAALPAPVDGKKYFIHFKGANKNGSFSVSGTNDWSVPEPPVTPDTTAIVLPFSQDGAGRFWFSTADALYSVTSSDMDTVLVNGANLTNQSTTSLPERIGGYYYIYYSTASANGRLDLELDTATPVDTVAVTLPFSQSGAGEYYFSTTEDIGSVSSSNMDVLTINGVSYTNQTSTSMPAKIDGHYYIYYMASQAGAGMQLEAPAAPPVPDLISWNGNDYTVEMMPYSKSGSGEHFVVVSGTVSSHSGSRLSIYEINGVNMLNGAALPAPVDGKKYFIHFKGANKNGSFSVSGTNDWSVPEPPVTPDTTAIVLPFSQDGAGRFWFSTADALYSVTSSDMDTVLVNGANLTNQSTTSLPERIGGYYYIYYSTASANGRLDLELDTATPVDTVAVTLPFSQSGAGEYYFSTTEDIGSVSSSNMDILTINGVNYTNQTSTSMPAKIDGHYYIYYMASRPDAGMQLEAPAPPPNPDTIEWNGNTYAKAVLPYAYDGGAVTRVYVYGKVSDFSSNNFITAISINGQSYSPNQTYTTMPPSIDQKFFITITPKNAKGHFEINGIPELPVYILNIKMLLEGAL